MAFAFICTLAAGTVFGTTGCVTEAPPDEGSGEQTPDGSNQDGSNQDGSNQDGSNQDGSNQDGSNQGQNNSCTETGGSCQSSSQCCNAQEGYGTCADEVCSDYCSFDSDCASDCCAPLNGGGAVCSPSSWCE